MNSMAETPRQDDSDICPGNRPIHRTFLHGRMRFLQCCIAQSPLNQRVQIAKEGFMKSSPIILEAIAKRKCITATYNKMHIRLAPHILYTRHDDLFVDGVTMERDGNPPREFKIGAFKLAGLSDVALAPEAFEPIADLDLKAPLYEGKTLFAVEG
jgi:hypothetical protein